MLWGATGCPSTGFAEGGRGGEVTRLGFGREVLESRGVPGAWPNVARIRSLRARSAPKLTEARAPSWGNAAIRVPPVSVSTPRYAFSLLSVVGVVVKLATPTDRASRGSTYTAFVLPTTTAGQSGCPP